MKIQILHQIQGSQLTEPSTADLHLSMLMEQGKAMVALLQSSVDEQKKDTDEWNQMQVIISTTTKHHYHR